MDVSSIDDEYVRLAQEAVFGVSISTLPGTFWAEYFPFLRYLPEWFPGSSFKKTMDYYRLITQEMRDKPFDKIQKDMVSLLHDQFDSATNATDRQREKPTHP